MKRLQKSFFVKFKQKDSQMVEVQKQIMSNWSINSHSKQFNSKQAVCKQRIFFNFQSQQGISIEQRMPLKSYKYSQKKSLVSLLVYTYVILSFFVQQAHGALTSSNLVANQFSDFQVDLFDVTKTMPAGSVVVITLPKDYSAVTLYNNKPYSGYDVPNNFCPVDCNTVTISYSAYVFVLNNMFPVSSMLLLSYTIINIKNPSEKITKTNDFTVQVRSADFVTLYYSQTITGVSISPDTFQSIASSLDYPFLWSISQLKFDISVDSVVDKIRLVFPSKWQNQTRVTDTVFPTAMVTSTTHMVNFSQLVQNIDVDFPQIFTLQTLTVTIKSIYTPSSDMDIGPITIEGYKSDGRIVRSSTIYISNTTLTNDYLRQTQAYVIYDQINNKISIRNKFKLPRDGIKNDKISFTYPSQITISTVPADYQLYLSGVLTPTTWTFPGSNVVQISPFGSTIFQPDVQVVMKINWPKAVVSTNNFTIQSFRKIGSIFAKMQQAVCCAIWIKQKPTLAVALTISNQQRLKSSVLYTFDLTHTFSILSSTDSIVIQFPQVYSMDVGKQAVTCSSIVLSHPSNTSNLNSPGYGCILSLNVLTLSNVFKSNQNPSVLTIKINVDNPASSPIQNFNIWSKDNTDAKIQSNSLVSVIITAASLSSVLTVPSSQVTNQRTSYIFTVTSIGIVSKNLFVRITVPIEIGVLEYGLKCQINAVNEFCSYDKVNRLIKIRSSSILASLTFQIKITNLINPETTSTTSNFKVQIQDTTGIIVESSSLLLSGLNVQMNAYDQFLYTRMQFDQKNLDQQGNLKFIAATNYPLTSGSTYKIDLVLSSSSYLYLNNVVCILTVNGNTVNYSAPNSGSSYTVTFTFAMSSATNILQFKFSNVYIFQDLVAANLTLSKQISLVFCQSVTLNSNIKLEYGLSSILISDYQVTQVSYFMNESPGLITLKINTISPNITISYAIISIPKNYQSASGTYIYNSTSSSTQISFLIADLLNPIYINLEQFTFILYDLNNQIVGLSLPSNQYFQNKCTFPCRGCNPVLPSLCTDCYQISGNTMIYFRLTQAPSYGQCTDQCQAGEYLDVNLKKCLPCDTNCSTCLISSGLSSGDSLKCLTCAIGNYLLTNRCYSTCPNGYYVNNLICSQCINNCAKCSSLNACNICNSPFFYYQGNQFLIQVIFIFTLGLCLQSCPLKTVAAAIPVSILSQCLSCSINCLKCSDINTCLLCDSGFYLYNSICLNACPLLLGNQLYPDLNNICSQCDCQSCAANSYNCLSCSPSLIYDSLKFKCLLKCQDNQYNNSGVCTDCPTECLYCTSPNICQMCNEPFILYKTNATFSQCVNTCPTSTVLTIQSLSYTTHLLECLPCTVGCSNCTLSSTFCISCSLGYLFYNNLCQLSCPAGYYNISNYCKKCQIQCLTCDTNDPSNCTQCVEGYYLQNSFCYVNCPLKTFPDISLKKCLDCQPLCETCLNASHCTSCKSGYFLFPNNLCYNTCPTTPVFYYTYKSQCVICQPQCNKCLSSPVQCVTCSSSYFFQNEDTKQCSTTCAPSYFVQGGQCIKCKSPCKQCDSTYDSCSSCYSNNTNKFLYLGNCIGNCPDGFYPDNYTNDTVTIQNKCLACKFPCAICTKTQCKTCETYAYMYKSSCVLDCSTTIDMPYQKDTYCTNCLSIPFCTFCEKSQTLKLKCWQCTYPYVLFEGDCLNSCPSNFVIVSQAKRECVESSEYIQLREKLHQKNKPQFPFAFLIIFIGLSILIYPLSKFVYEYTYHIGYEIFLINLLDYILVYNWLINYDSRYFGEYFDGDQRNIPLFLILSYLVINLVIFGWLAFSYVIKYVYLNDIRYNQWKIRSNYNFYTLLILLICLGPRSHKLYYSKLFGLENFSYRVVSVQKFHLEDRINLLTCFGDIILLIAFVIVTYNIFIEYSVLYLTAFQILIIKIIAWTLLALDSKKPDRGFFYGDQKLALQQIEKEQQQNLAHLRRIDTDHLIKMIRQKSAGLLQYNRQPFGQIQKTEFLSVYDPDDYQEVKKVPLKRIERNINLGKFRKGRKITIQQKLQRFADSIKPRPIVKKVQQYLHSKIYYQPPKKLKISKNQRIEPISQESMLKILQDKQLQYKEDLDYIQNIVFDQRQVSNHNFRTGQFFYRNSNRLNIESHNELQQSNGSIQQFEDISSQIFKPKQEIEYNDLMNLNYAKKRHLPHQQKKPQFDSNDMRILYHQPMKKRKNSVFNQ